MAEFSQAVLQQRNNAEEITRGIDTHKPRIFSKMAVILKPYMTEEECNRFLHEASFLFDLQTTHLNAVTEQMGIADLEHTTELLQTEQARGGRDLVLIDTFKVVSSLKQAILGFHGDAGLSILGMAVQTPRTPVELERYLENVVHIANQGVVMPEQVLPGPVVWTADAVLQIVRPLLNQLRDALDLVSREQQEDKDTMTRKWELMELQNQLYISVASIAESYARFVGDHDLGERLRPRPISRPGRKKDQEDGGNGIDPQPPVDPITPVSPNPVA